MFELKLSEFIIASKNTHINNRIEFRVEHTRAHFGPIRNADVIAERICFSFYSNPNEHRHISNVFIFPIAK